jgi:carbonic anhydrase
LFLSVFQDATQIPVEMPKIIATKRSLYNLITMENDNLISSKDALAKLLEGNSRFSAGALTSNKRADQSSREALVQGQSPYASLVCCADSRTPASHIFDGGLGELFVCRNAGNIVDDVVLGSLEYAVAHLGTSLIGVVGHNNCGAVGAAVSAFKNPEMKETPSINGIIQRLVRSAVATRPTDEDDKNWVDEAAKWNVKAQCETILSRSKLIADKVEQGTVEVVGLWYDLATGQCTKLYQ